MRRPKTTLVMSYSHGLNLQVPTQLRPILIQSLMHDSVYMAKDIVNAYRSPNYEGVTTYNGLLLNINAHRCNNMCARN